MQAPAGVPRAFFARDATVLAPLLLGAVVRHSTAEGTVAVRLSEVEAYRGNGEDPGSHAHRGVTPRTRVMFGPPAHLYAYFSYGMHVCANIVCAPDGQAAGLLLRGGAVVEGLELARLRRPTAATDRELARGPARLASALGIRLEQSGADLLAPPFSIELPASPAVFATTARTGVGGEGGGAAFPWRFYLPGDPTVSPYKRHPKRAP
ncbi:DNA-3-methyladenine glycosylase [Microterricola pindariensis]|uniref:Putative 3-methyladenine DNA glycosylase n=1 Tax=Microterricola pindariensis TaxID=478010 RepID=A0ABX5AXV6_9MICO|nr:DNA-3-methyladenine glycosylase [Microterricola pindariensis]PPL19298.1 3-methyladenine DNA glycosylase [Microterricola pindariensis]